MSHEHETPTADPIAPDAAPVDPRPEARPDFLDRARRILAGDVRPDDYLPEPDEVKAAVADHLRAIELEHGFEVTPEARRHSLNDWTYQFHHAGDVTLAKYTDRGVLVLAVGDEQIGPINRHFNPDYRHGFALRFPYTG